MFTRKSVQSPFPNTKRWLYKYHNMRSNKYKVHILVEENGISAHYTVKLMGRNAGNTYQETKGMCALTVLTGTLIHAIYEVVQEEMAAHVSEIEDMQAVLPKQN